MNCVSKKFGYDNCLAIDWAGLGGGLALLWQDKTQVIVNSYSVHHIDLTIKMDEGKMVAVYRYI